LNDFDAEDRLRFEQLVLPHVDAAFNLARWLLRSRADAEDVAQEALLRSISVLKTNELEKYLLVARCAGMWLRMRGVPRIFPIAKQQLRSVPAYHGDINP
jgi:hypothetical protein